MTVEVRSNGPRWEVRHMGIVVGTFPDRDPAEAAGHRLAEKHSTRLILPTDAGGERVTARYTLTGAQHGD